MPAAGVVVLAAALAAVAAFAPLRWGFAALVGTVLLVPATLVVPNGFTPVPTVGRVVLVAGALALAVRTWRGDVPAGTWAPTRVHVALGAFLAVALLVGVGAAAPTASLATSVLTWLDLVEQAAFFVVALAWIRALGDLREVARLVTGVLLVVALVAVVEHLTGRSWGAWLFAGVPAQQGTNAATALGVRAGQVRVRAGAEFALEYAWVAVALLPLAAVAATRLRRRWRWPATVVLVGLPVLSIYWSFTRSAAVGLVLVLLVAALAARDRPLGVLAGIAVVAVSALLLVVPSTLHALSFAVDRGAINVRFERLPAILGLVASRPWTGLGLGGLDAAGFPTTDSSFLLAYADLGVTGAATLVAMLLVALAGAGAAVLGGRGTPRRVGAAAVAGAAALVIGAVTFDAFSVLGAARVFWLLVALGVVAGEQVRGRTRRAVFVPRRLVWPLALAVVGGLAALLAPVHVARSFAFATLSARDEAVAYDPVSVGQTLIHTTCGAASAVTAEHAGATVSCRDRHDAAGVGMLRVAAPSPAALESTVTAIVHTVRTTTPVTGLTLLPEAPPGRGRPTLLATAPLWLFVLGLLALLWPTRPPRPGTAAARRSRLGGDRQNPTPGTADRRLPAR